MFCFDITKVGVHFMTEKHKKTLEKKESKKKKSKKKKSKGHKDKKNKKTKTKKNAKKNKMLNASVSIPVKIKRFSMEIMFSLIDIFEISTQSPILGEILNKIKYFVLILGGLILGLIELILLFVARCFYGLAVWIALMVYFMQKNTIEFILVGGIVIFIIYIFKRLRYK